MKIPEELLNFIISETEKDGCQLVDVASRGGGPSLTLEIVVDKDGGITLDECAGLNRKITAWIYKEKVFPEGCVLDVCSPGLDKELKSDMAFCWAVGKKVRVNTYEPIDGRRSITGTLTGEADRGGITLEEGGGNKVRVDKKNIAKARLCFPA